MKVFAFLAVAACLPLPMLKVPKIPKVDLNQAAINVIKPLHPTFKSAQEYSAKMAQSTLNAARQIKIPVMSPEELSPYLRKVQTSSQKFSEDLVNAAKSIKFQMSEPIAPAQPVITILNPPKPVYSQETLQMWTNKAISFKKEVVKLEAALAHIQNGPERAEIEKQLAFARHRRAQFESYLANAANQ